MSDKKHIDRLFQEGFKDFEAQPSDAVWKNIEAKLNAKKKKHRVIPIWWRYAGAAALLLLFLTVGGLYFNSSNNNSNTIVDTENPPIEEFETNRRPTLNNIDHIDHKESIATENINPNEHSDKSPQTKSEYASPSKPASVTKTTPLTVNTKNNSNLVLTTGKDDSKTHFTNSNKSEAVAANLADDKPGDKTLYDENTSVVTTSNDKDNTPTPLVDKEQAKKLINNTSVPNSTEIAKTKANKASEKVSETSDENKLLTIEEALENNKDILNEEVVNNSKNRWSIAPNAAPVYFNTLGEGSSIDPQFNNNSKTGELNMSYGIKASYAVNNKIKIRSGINKVNLGYNTNDIILYQSVGLSSSSSALQNVNSRNSSGYSAISSESIDAQGLPQALLSSNTTINQAFGYLEVPLEIQYTLSDKKFGINVIGGFSSFFLDNNEVYSKAENGPRVFLGEANNINKISYSANFGLGLNYEVSKTFDLSLEPMFKYQFNTFNSTSGNFTPFFIGVYTGFAIKF